MNVSKNTWHYRVFEWQLMQKYGFIPWTINAYGSNLCSYVRTVLLWAPLRFLFNTTWVRSTATASIMFSIVTGLIGAFAGLHGLKIEAGIILTVLIAATMLGTIVSFVWLASLLAEYARNKNLRVPDTIVSFSELLTKRVRSIHDGICPEITFKDEQ